MRRYQTVILGAGLCGLSAAYHLEGRGEADYLLVERAGEVGGLARTVTYDGFSFDHAIHILYSTDAYVADLVCNRLLRGNTCKQVRRSYCYTAGVYTEYPYQLNNYGLPPQVIEKNLAGLAAARAAAEHGAPPADFEEWIERTYGRGIADHFMIPYNRRQWAWDLREMSYEWIDGRVAVPTLEEVQRGATAPSAERYGANREFWYPLAGGIQALARAFASHIPPERLWLNAEVVAVDAARREIVLADGGRVGYGRLIASTPMPALVAMLDDAVSLPIRQSAAQLKYNTVHTVNIGLVGHVSAPLGSMHWVYLPEDHTIFHRLSLPSNFAEWMVPPGCSSIQVEISESVHRPCDRAALVEQALAGLTTIGVLTAPEARPVARGGRVRVAEVVSLSPAYIIYDLRHREHTQRIRAELARWQISPRGRFGSWEYLNMDHAILDGKAAVEDEARRRGSTAEPTRGIQ